MDLFAPLRLQADVSFTALAYSRKLPKLSRYVRSAPETFSFWRGARIGLKSFELGLHNSVPAEGFWRTLALTIECRGAPTTTHTPRRALRTESRWRGPPYVTSGRRRILRLSACLRQQKNDARRYASPHVLTILATRQDRGAFREGFCFIWRAQSGSNRRASRRLR